MDLSKLSGSIWLDGELVPWQEAKVHVLTHTFHYGVGVFEGVRAYSTPIVVPVFSDFGTHGPVVPLGKNTADEHAWDRDALNAAQREVVRVNGLEEGYLRPMCFLGSEGMGLRADNLQTHVMVVAWPGLPIWIRKPRTGASRCVRRATPPPRQHHHV